MAFDDALLRQTVDALLKHPQLWRGERRTWAGAQCIPTGFARLDERLPGGGWSGGALTEILLPRPGIGELQLLLPALRRVGKQRRWIALIDPPYTPYPPAWQASGLDLSRLLWVRPRTDQDRLWSLEQALQAGTCGAVLGWPPASVTFQQLRRLQLAAEGGACMGILFQPRERAPQATPAALRIRLEPRGPGLDVHLLKGGRREVIAIG